MPLLESTALTQSVAKDHLDWALMQFFKASRSNNQSIVDARKKALGHCAPGTFGYALNTYYLANAGLPFPGSPDSMFPSDYLALHDAHHVLVGADTKEAGEVYVTAFECGLITGASARILPVLAQIQVLLEHKGIELYDAPTAFLAYQRGVECHKTFLDEFDPWDALETPIALVREQFNIVPISTLWG